MRMRLALATLLVLSTQACKFGTTDSGVKQYESFGSGICQKVNEVSAQSAGTVGTTPETTFANLILSEKACVRARIDSCRLRQVQLKEEAAKQAANDPNAQGQQGQQDQQNGQVAANDQSSPTDQQFAGQDPSAGGDQFASQDQFSTGDGVLALQGGATGEDCGSCPASTEAEIAQLLSTYEAADQSLASCQYTGKSEAVAAKEAGLTDESLVAFEKTCGTDDLAAADAVKADVTDPSLGGEQGVGVLSLDTQDIAIKRTTYKEGEFKFTVQAGTSANNIGGGVEAKSKEDITYSGKWVPDSTELQGLVDNAKLTGKADDFRCLANPKGNGGYNESITKISGKVTCAFSVNHALTAGGFTKGTVGTDVFFGKVSAELVAKYGNRTESSSSYTTDPIPLEKGKSIQETYEACKNWAAQNAARIDAMVADGRSVFADAVNRDANAIGAGVKPSKTNTCYRETDCAEGTFNNRQRRCIAVEGTDYGECRYFEREGSTCNSAYSKPCDYLGGLSCESRVTSYFATPSLPLSKEWKCRRKK